MIKQEGIDSSMAHLFKASLALLRPLINVPVTLNIEA